MILVREQIEEKAIIRYPHPKGTGWRPTTYDATVGEIIMEGKSIADNSFTLPPRGIVWVISNEEFHLPKDVTGLATLRTTWTHNGILALNVGVVDPGWSGHLATAIVNFSMRPFEIQKGQAFFRVMFLCHNETPTPHTGDDSTAYVDKIRIFARLFSGTFLTMDTLIVEVSEKVLGFPRWALWLAAGAILVSVFSIVLPVAWTAVSQNYVMPGRVDALEKAVSVLQSSRQGSY